MLTNQETQTKVIRLDIFNTIVFGKQNYRIFFFTCSLYTVGTTLKKQLYRGMNFLCETLIYLTKQYELKGRLQHKKEDIKFLKKREGGMPTTAHRKEIASVSYNKNPRI